MDERSLRDLLKDVLGANYLVTTCTLLKDRPDYQVWKADLGRPDKSLIIKLAGETAQYASSFEHTAVIHRLVKEHTAIPMPEVLLAGRAGPNWPWQVFIKTYIPGQELAVIRPTLTTNEMHSVQAQVGDAVAQIHSISLAGFGTLDAHGLVEDPRPAAEALEAHARRIIPHPADIELFLAALEPRRSLFAGVQPASLCHEDLHAHNLIFTYANDSWQLATILDFEKAWAGPRESDLARMELWKMTAKPFWQAYNARAPLHPGYPQRRALFQLLWCLEVAWGDAGHQATTAALLRELGLK